MSVSIDPGSFWQALQAVDDGEEPSTVYARTMMEAEHEEVLDDYEAQLGDRNLDPDLLG